RSCNRVRTGIASRPGPSALTWRIRPQRRIWYPRGYQKLLTTPILHAKRSNFSAKAVACDVRCRSDAKDWRQGQALKTDPRTGATVRRAGVSTTLPPGPPRAGLDLVPVGVEDGGDGRVAPGQLQGVRRQFGQRRTVLRPRFLGPRTAHHLAVFH